MERVRIEHQRQRPRRHRLVPRSRRTPYPVAQYAFKHPLTLEVAYQSQLGDRRARVHASVAQALERLRADRLGEFASLIAHHWEVSGSRFEAM